MDKNNLSSILGNDDLITLTSSGHYDWSAPVNSSLTPSTISVLDTSSATITSAGLTTGASTLPYSSIGHVTGINGSLNPSVSIWSDSASVLEPSGHIDLKGENADITINGRSLNQTIQALEERLNMLRPNEHLEAEWDQLRELGEQYRKLEADLIEKQRAWEILKKQ